MKYNRLLSLWAVVLLAASLGAGCRTLDYRQIQSEFDRAVQADNVGNPFGGLHEDIVNRLTPEYIAALEPKLRPNAWMLRAVSAWRAGLTNDIAQQSASRGLSDTNLVTGSRDQIILLMIPALVVDSDLQRRWLAANRQITGLDYQNIYERTGFEAALTELARASDVMNERTPVDARAYYHFQRWRVLINWAAVVGSIRPAQDAFEAQRRANLFVKTTGLDAAAEFERDQIPMDQPLRVLIRAMGGG